MIPPINTPWTEHDIYRACDYWNRPDLWQTYLERKDLMRKPFVSDGPSGGFPRYWKGHDLYKTVAAPHDLAYWLGGSPEQKYIADCYLAINAVQTTQDILCGEVMRDGVTIGGEKSILHFPYEWGYGEET
jgi:hypothetical protein